jgi:hypothetical protein
MAAIVIRTRLDEGTESAEVATSVPCLILNQYNNKIPKAINTITNYRSLFLQRTQEQKLIISIVVSVVYSLCSKPV